MDVALEAAALRFPMPAEGDEDARTLALEWQRWATETLLRQANGYAHDGKFGIVLADGTTLATRDVFSVPQENWRVTASERETALKLFKDDPVHIRPIFYMPVRPAEVPPALKLLPRDTSVSLRWTWRRFSESVGPAVDAIEAFEATLRRQAQGWLVIEEAVHELQAAGRGTAKTWTEKLEEAAQSGDLPMHEPESLERVSYKPTRQRPEPRRVRDFYDWVHVDDLNAWLRAHEPRLPYQFESPANQDYAAKPRQVQANNAVVVSLAGERRTRREAPTDSPFDGLSGVLYVRAGEQLFALRDIPEMTARALVPGASTAVLPSPSSSGISEDDEGATFRLLFALVLDDHRRRLNAALADRTLISTWGRLPPAPELQEVLPLGELRQFCESIRVEVAVLNDDEAREATPVIAISHEPATKDVDAHPAISVSHVLSSRRDVLDPIIDLAERNATNPDDRAAVWNAFAALAVSASKPPPLLGFADRSIQYLDGDEAKFLTRDAFNKRWERRKGRAAGSRR
ncbi:MAG TPA: hypothetical protein VF453_08365 [Burkholderiaceae bacterium]